jgi:DNA-binding transcriptional LysR family regulator
VTRIACIFNHHCNEAGRIVKKIHVRQVEAFRAVVTLGSMSKAAELMGISQPAVSRLIADFQHAVGFQLFKRRRNSAEPTPDARLLFEQVEKVFHGLEELVQGVDAIRNMQVGRIVITATSSYSTGMLPDIIAEFKRAHANVTIALHIQSHEQVVDWVSAGRADIGFAIQPISSILLSVRQVRTRGAHCILPAGHPLETKAVLKPSDLANLPYVSFARGTPLRFQIDNLFDRLGVERLLHVEATSHQAICALVSAGLGVALVNPFAPIDGYPNRLIARPMKPSVILELQMLWNETSLSICSSEFRDFFLQAAAKRLAHDSTERDAALSKRGASRGSRRTSLA